MAGRRRPRRPALISFTSTLTPREELAKHELVFADPATGERLAVAAFFTLPGVPDAQALAAALDVWRFLSPTVPPEYALPPGAITVALQDGSAAITATPSGSIPDTATLDLTIGDLSRLVPTQLPNLPHYQRNASLTLDNSALYVMFRTAVSNGSNEFVVGGEHLWPTAMVETRNRQLQAIAQVQPDPRLVDPFALSADELAHWQERMARHVMEMDDLTADVLDGIAAIWLQTVKHPDEMANIHVDELLRLRGLRPNVSGDGYRGGYKDKQRREIAAKVAALSLTYITVFRREVTEGSDQGRPRGRRRTTWAGQSPALVVSFEVGQVGLGGTVIPESCVAWRVRPGDVFSRFLFGVGRELALLSTKTLQYDPYRQQWEKRLARYLSWLWRIRQRTGAYADPLTVRTLLEAIKWQVNPHDPVRTKERLEHALDTLVRDGVIAGWQYTDSVDEQIVGRKGWAGQWLTWKVTIEPPQSLVAHYALIDTPPVRGGGRPQLRPPREDRTTGTDALGMRIAQVRTAHRLTQLQAAEEIGIDNTMLSRIERGRTRPTRATRQRLEAWLATREAGANTD